MFERVERLDPYDSPHQAEPHQVARVHGTADELTGVYPGSVPFWDRLAGLFVMRVSGGAHNGLPATTVTLNFFPDGDPGESGRATFLNGSWVEFERVFESVEALEEFEERVKDRLPTGFERHPARTLEVGDVMVDPEWSGYRLEVTEVSLVTGGDGVTRVRIEHDNPEWLRFRDCLHEGADLSGAEVTCERCGGLVGEEVEDPGFPPTVEDFLELERVLAVRRA